MEGLLSTGPTPSSFFLLIGPCFQGHYHFMFLLLLWHCNINATFSEEFTNLVKKKNLITCNGNRTCGLLLLLELIILI